MQKLKEQLEAATQAFEDAQARLERARAAYTTGAGKQYAEAIKSADTLPAQTAGHQQAHENAKAALENAMLSSGGQITSEVKTALAARRDAEDLIEQLATLERLASRTRQTIHIAASGAAREYVQAYEAATRTWSEMNVLSALVECGERIARAMAVVPIDERLVPHATRTYKYRTACMDRMLIELDRLRGAFKDEAAVYQEVIGSIDLGALQCSEILSVAKVHTLSRKLHAVTQ
ncbi:hypothetical protein SY87_07560 [Burkholderia pseudomallei]|uniref:hypothetical protein n=1 Tax=Burkholderia pseudomallei TaxID=28450 RepID=UPI0005C7EDBC|nr:hypothetical protein [Burkholderia pseudomallei]KIX48624.1 hypothetical protein SY87_07560 [Burkholderia pseudomallei]